MFRRKIKSFGDIMWKMWDNCHDVSVTHFIFQPDKMLAGVKQCWKDICDAEVTWQLIRENTRLYLCSRRQSLYSHKSGLLEGIRGLFV